MEFEYWNLDPGAALNLSVLVVNEDGTTVFNTGPVREKEWNGRPFPSRQAAQDWESRQPGEHGRGGARAAGPWYGYSFDYDR